MTITRTTNAGTFDARLYTDLNNMAAQYLMEDTDITWVPHKDTTKLLAPKYKKPILSASQGVVGGHTIGRANRTMYTPRNHTTYDLEDVEAWIDYDANDMALNAEYLAQEKAQELKTWVDQVKQSYFKGVFERGFDEDGKGLGFRLNDGIIEQATLVEDLNGGDSKLDAAGDVYLALDKIVNSIPFRIRQGRRVMVGCDDLFYRMAHKALFRGSTNQLSEFDLFFKELSERGPSGVDPRVQPPLLVSDKLFLNLVAGTTKTEVDTVGTHSRLFAAVLDPEVFEGVSSFYGMMGEDVIPSIRGVSQHWVARLAGAVHQTAGVTFSERITWA